MKKMFAFALLLSAFAGSAQMKEGRIVYERTMQLQRPRAFANGQEMPIDMPRSRTDQWELLFGNNQSVYQFLPSAAGEEQSSFSGGGGNVMFRFAGGNNNVVYHNFGTSTRVDHNEFMDKEFLITDTIARHQWKLSDETKQILNYTARKAVSQRINPSMRMTMENGEMKRTEVMDTVAVVAWFTTDIPVPVGPDMQGGLPGAILELDVNKGRVVYKAVEVSPKVAVAKIKAPTRGKKVNNQEYRAETGKIMEEMRRNMQNRGGNVEIIRN